MKAHVRVIITAERDMNTNEIDMTIEVDACDDMPDSLVMPTAVAAMAMAGPKVETAAVREMVRDTITRTIDKLKERSSDDGPTDAGGPT